MTKQKNDFQYHSATVIESYSATYPNPIKLKTGEPVTIEKWEPKDSEWAGWAFCVDSRGIKGWVSERYLEVNGSAATATRDYDATELTVRSGESLKIYFEEFGWAWVENSSGSQGWVPVKNIAQITPKMEFQPLTQTDLPLLHTWLNQEHLRAHYQKEPITLEAVVQKYSPRIHGEVPTFCHIAVVNGRPIGKIQCYRVANYPDYAAEIGVSEGISVDLFIGDPFFLGKGFGKAMLRQYLKLAFAKFPNERHCYICHDVNNKTALSCSKSAGFQWVKNVIEEGAQCELLVFGKGSREYF
jgi:aminoglycoside 6'-N-acetyltransferase